MRNAMTHVAFAVLALWTIQLWLFHGIIPVEAGDEAAHTFVELPLYFRALLDGHFLHMNMFNAFGTPLTGDPVFIPWAPHSLTYALFAGWQGLMINKVIILFLTLEVLYFLSLRIGLNHTWSMWSAIMTGLNPAYVYFLNHHPHQGAILYFTFFILCLERLFNNFSNRNLLVAATAYVLFLVGVGVNGIVNGHLFILGYLVVSNKRLQIQQWAIIGLALGGGLLFYLPHFISFLNWAPLTVRSQHRIFDLPNVGHFEWQFLFNGMSEFLETVRIHIDLSVVQTLVFLVLSAFTFIFWRRQIPAQTRRISHSALMALGMIPSLIVFVLLVRIDWLLLIPFFKSTDITRVLWFSLIFSHLAMAGILQDLSTEKSNCTLQKLPTQLAMAAILGAMIFGFRNIHLPSSYPTLNTIVLVSSVIALAAVAWLVLRPPAQRWIGVIMALTLLPKLVVFHHLTTVIQSSPDQFGVIPPGLETALQPNSRMASLYPFGESPDQRLASHSILGSGARSIILSSEMKGMLISNGLINEDTNSYSMKASAIDQFDALGIRYLVTRGTDIQSPKWNFLRELQWRDIPYRVYERTQAISLAYCATSPIHYFQPELTNNQLSFVVDQACPIAIATQFRWPGWIVSINGRTSTMPEPGVVFLSAGPLQPGDRVKFKFSPWWVRHWWAFGLMGLTALGLAVKFNRPGSGLSGTTEISDSRI